MKESFPHLAGSAELFNKFIDGECAQGVKDSLIGVVNEGTHSPLDSKVRPGISEGQAGNLIFCGHPVKQGRSGESPLSQAKLLEMHHYLDLCQIEVLYPYSCNDVMMCRMHASLSISSV
jgi:hypothetical protein